MTEKEFRTWLIVDYKNGKFRVGSTRRKIIQHLKPTEIPIDVKIKVTVPETPIYSASGEIVVSPTKMNEMIISALEEEQ